jgi:hypothetical protein
MNNWLIWSNEHKAWWKPNSMGYTTSRKEAGRYTMERATEICRCANHWTLDNETPNETMVLE